MNDEQEDGPRPDSYYLEQLQKSRDESRAARSVIAQAPLPERLAGPPAPRPAAPALVPGAAPDLVILGAIGGDGQFSATPTQPGETPNRQPDPASPLPFEVIDPNTPSATQVFVQVNPHSILRKRQDTTLTVPIDNLGSDFQIVAGHDIYLQVDTDDAFVASSATIVTGVPPYAMTNELITVAGTGTDDDPYIWDQTFFPIAQVFASDGTTPHGGTIFSAGTIVLEVVQLFRGHLALGPFFYNGVYTLVPQLSAGYFAR